MDGSLLQFLGQRWPTASPPPHQHTVLALPGVSLERPPQRTRPTAKEQSRDPGEHETLAGKNGIWWVEEKGRSLQPPPGLQGYFSAVAQRTPNRRCPLAVQVAQTKVVEEQQVSSCSSNSGWVGGEAAATSARGKERGLHSAFGGREKNTQEVQVSRLQSLRCFSTSRRQMENKVHQYQKLFQEDNGLPVHLKKGMSDMVMYRITMAIGAFGVCWALYRIHELGRIKK
ncbi:cytochrome c oxidase subunit 7A1, mitochondrial [Erythrolamprus reginae]|uniref:cytochrome c oxidase subunit 7A1, mitochondrial n=1 Tax=Erythrolamprus reginae TaxID=121349 RepID=UPI00396CC6B0